VIVDGRDILRCEGDLTKCEVPRDKRLDCE